MPMRSRSFPTSPVYIRTMAASLMLCVSLASGGNPCPNPIEFRCPNGVCRNLLQDPQYCGDCDSSCPLAWGCFDGTCAPICPPGTIPCSGSCVDATSNPAHCGACGNSCGIFVCVNGACYTRCSLSLTVCDGTCADLQTDERHCGQCGRTCADYQACVSGRCILDCPPGLTNCFARCVDLQRDEDHCGACKARCDPGELCNGTGVCELTCQPGLTNCSGVCVDLSRDRENCGACGASCPTGEICDGTGRCLPSCQVGLTNCAGDCVDLRRDRKNCGACGASCASGELCDGTGVCMLTCQPGLTNCAGVCVHLQSDREHCGACGASCAPGEVCDGTGRCRLTCQAGLTDCGGRCSDLLNDRENCGACGAACFGGELCMSGQCRCPAGQQPCADRCVEFDSDADNCGACGRECLPGWSCQDGVCLPRCVDVGMAVCAPQDVFVVTSFKDPHGLLVSFQTISEALDPLTLRTDDALNDVITTDLNQDGRMDIITAQRGQPGRDGWPSAVLVALNEGQGTFTKLETVVLGAEPLALAAGDLDGDTFPDVVAVAGAGVVTLCNDGFGGLAVNATYSAFPNDGFTFQAPRFVDVGDVTHDGANDIIVSDAAQGMVVILVNDGTGGFSHVMTLPFSDGPAGVAVRDFDVIAPADIAVVLSDNRRVAVLLSDGHGGFLAPSFYETGPEPQSIAARDLTGDAVPDLVVLGVEGASVTVLRNTGDGRFEMAQLFQTPLPDATDIATGDISGDGLGEVAVAMPRSSQGGDVVIYENTVGVIGPELSIRIVTVGRPTGVAMAGFEPRGICVDLVNDPANCGACDHVCRPNEDCRSGRCMLKVNTDNDLDVDLRDARELLESFNGPS